MAERWLAVFRIVCVCRKPRNTVSFIKPFFMSLEYRA